MRRLIAAFALSLAAACSHQAASSTPASSPDDAAPVAKREPAPRTERRERERPAADAQPAPVHEGKQKGALAQIESRSGSRLVGTARFTAKAGGGVVMHLVVAGATQGDHSVILHEAGDCGGSNADHAGGQLGVDGAQLGNVTVDASGNGSLDGSSPGITISGADSGIVGRAIVIHDRADDARASSPRLGCGVIKAE